MSEYQYYEFRAVDRPLTSRELSSLRAISSRAAITPTSFVNTYNYGDFRGDPDALMGKYFNAFVYVANWGTREFTVRVPGDALGHEEYAPYCGGDSLRVRTAREHLVLSFRANELESDWEEGEGWMDSLLPLRADLLRGDLRALYLGWLRAVEQEEIGDDQPEPPVPAGLRNLSEPLERLAEFLEIDTNLLESAAEASADLESASPPGDLLAQWIAGLPEHEKNALLVQVAKGEAPHVGADLLRRFRLTSPKAPSEEERKEREREIEQQRRAAERTRRLNDLQAREESAWMNVDQLITTKRQNDYDRAILLLVDLRDLAARAGRGAVFEQRLRGVVGRHASKPSLLRKLREAGLESA